MPLGAGTAQGMTFEVPEFEVPFDKALVEFAPPADGGTTILTEAGGGELA